LIRQFETELGDNLTEGQRLGVERAAVMTAVAEDARIRKLNGASDISYDDLVRLDRVAAHAVRTLGIKFAPAKPQTPTLAEYLGESA
jgi:hypothetical protein